MQFDVLKLKVSAFFSEGLPGLARQIKQYGLLMRLHRPIGAWLLLWPVLWTLWIAADGRPDPKIFTVFVIGVWVMRSAGCVINDFADRKFDPHVKRSMDRPLAAGRVSSIEALLLFVGLGIIAFGLVLTMNTLTIKLSFAGIFLAVTYPYLKRYTPLPQFYLGAAFGWGAPMAYAAQVGELHQMAWLIFLAVILWAAIYDTEYAMVDREDDLKIGIKSTAILFGDNDRLVIALIQALFILNLYLIGRTAELGTWYQVGVGAALVLSVYQQFLIRNRDPDACFKAFHNNNWLGAAVFAGIVLHYTFGA